MIDKNYAQACTEVLEILSYFTEEEYLNNNEYSSITLGNRIMRVETVPLFVLSAINYECME